MVAQSTQFINDLLDSWDDEYSPPLPTDPEYGKVQLDAIEHRVKEDLNASLPSFNKRYPLDELRFVSDILDKTLYPKVVNSVKSFVGDDETITADSVVFCVLCILIGPIISRIKISWEDVGFNKHLFNYAEGYVFLPPSQMSSFEAINRYAKGNGIPIVLDPVKLKNLSCVRKQSEMDRDLPSKFRNLAEAASWTNRNWPTYNLHQFALLIGVEIFDFMRAKQYPYLYKTEGGCGGSPPWGNLFTSAAAMFRYRRGRARRGIVGIMKESTMLLNGQIEPSETFFVKNLSLATSGDIRWEAIRSIALKTDEQWNSVGLDKPTPLELTDEEIVPPELLVKSDVVKPRDALTGIAISFLREKGYLLTEYDLVQKAQEKKRLEALWGRVPLKDIADQIELRKQKYKEAFLETLSLMDTSEKIHPDVVNALSKIKDPFDPESLQIMDRYYRLRVEQASYITSFIYNDRIRIFRTKDVEEYYSRGLKGLKNAFAEAIETTWRPEHRKTIQLHDEKQKYDLIEEWLDSGPLPDLLNGAIPPGVGPDDSRICRDILNDIDIWKASGRERFLFFLVTADRKLVNGLSQIIHHRHPLIKWRIVSIRPTEYLQICLSPEERQVYRPIQLNWLNSQTIYNLVRKQNERLPSVLYKELVRNSRFLGNGEPYPVFSVYYDYPNINRGLASFKLTDGNLEQYTQGYLTTDFAKSRPGLVNEDINELFRSKQFLKGYKRSIAPLDKIRSRTFNIRTSENP